MKQTAPLVIIEPELQHITFVQSELPQWHKWSKHSETYYGKVFVSCWEVNLRGIRRDYNFDSNLFLHPWRLVSNHSSWEATLRCWLRKLKFRCRTSHFNHHNRVLIVHLFRDGRAFSFLVFLLLPNKIDGDPTKYKNHHSCSQTKYEQELICSETQKSHVNLLLWQDRRVSWVTV